MKIVWDERKRRINLEKHELDFKDMQNFEWPGAAIEETRPSAFGNRRYQAIGNIGEKVVTAIIAYLGSEAISVISLRRADAGEKEKLEWSRQTRH